MCCEIVSYLLKRLNFIRRWSCHICSITKTDYTIEPEIHYTRSGYISPPYLPPEDKLTFIEFHPRNLKIFCAERLKVYVTKATSGGGSSSSERFVLNIIFEDEDNQVRLPYEYIPALSLVLSRLQPLTDSEEEETDIEEEEEEIGSTSRVLINCAAGKFFGKKIKSWKK